MLPIWGFIAVTLPLVATPGVSTTVVLRNSIGGGTRSGVMTAVGCNLGNLTYGVLTAFGFGIALQRWPSVWLVLRAAGVTYLAWLAIRSVWRAVSPPASHSRGDVAFDADALRSMVSGFLANVLNPSLVAFYLIVVPQFIPRGAPFPRSALTLSAVHVGLAFPWHCLWAVAGSTMARVLVAGAPRRVLDAITGVALLWLAAKVAF